MKHTAIPTLITVALILAATSSAAPHVTTVYGVVGPGYTITLKTAAGKPVRTLPAGLVVFHISDRSTNHNFHLTGPGVDRSTEVAQRTTTTWTIKLKPHHTYRYMCDPHQLIMHGSFRTT